MNFTHPGLHDVIIGSTPPFVNLSTNSFASSIIVRSAPVFVSKTLSNPSFFNAVTIFPVTFVPRPIPNSSPSATLTDGAVCTTTKLSLSFNFLSTNLVSSFSLKAPTGQASIHCPQKVQFTLFKLASLAVDIFELKPLPATANAPMFCTFLHIATHLLHKTHLLASLTIDGDNSSILFSTFCPSNSISVIPNFLAKSCNSQFPFLVHVKHSLLCADNIKSSITLLASFTSSVFVLTIIPSSTCVMHDGVNPLLPFMSTMHILQSPAAFISFKKHNVGISIFNFLAAFKTVVPFSTSISVPSIVNLIISAIKIPPIFHLF